jgi:radical SAM/Cys-rich protein
MVLKIDTAMVENKYDFNALLEVRRLDLKPVAFKTLWVNVTRLCNQSCRHCHVGASPARTEQMDRRTVDRCLEILAAHPQCENLDITGGAPELNPHFDYFVTEARKLKKHVLVRHNLTVISDGNPRTGESKAYLPGFFAENRVEVLASLAHYDPVSADSVRGKGVFEKSLKGLRLLNEQGYGKEGGALVLNLVYNHDGPLKPDDRIKLEGEFRRRLTSRSGIFFNRLFTVTNMPVNRYYARLKRSGVYDRYMDGLVAAFSASAAELMVCRSLVSVGWDGRLFDCDFNYMLDLPINTGQNATVFNFDIEAVMGRRINFASHCFGCASGGSS